MATEETNPVISSPGSPITLISPPAINRTTAMSCTPKHKPTKNLDDLLSTLNFDVNPSATQSTPTTNVNSDRSVVTDIPSATRSTPTTNENSDRSVVTDIPQITNTEQTGDELVINHTDDNNSSNGMPRSVVTIEPANCSHNITTLDGETDGTTTTRSATTSPKPPNKCNDQVSTTSIHKDVLSEYNSDELPDLVLPQTRSVTTDPRIPHIAHNNSSTEQTPKRTQPENMSQPSTTPRSVLSDPDDTEIETANTLLSLGSLENIDQAVDNETLLPIDKPRARDFAQELATQYLNHG